MPYKNSGNSRKIKMKKTDVKKNILKWIFLIFIVIWVGMIFYFSSQIPEISHKQSGFALDIFHKINDVMDISDTAIFKKAEHFIKDVLLNGRYETPNAVIRKSAHFGIYMALGMLSCIFAYIYGKKLLLAFIIGVSFPIMIAVFDEYNQKFTGRTSSLEDVLLDGAGALVGTVFVVLCILIWFLIKLILKRSYKKNL